ncbi:MAG: MBOAT family protein [Clostridia bacterium]|nr:MBOAT family protein [Clostridia bacterium]
MVFSSIPFLYYFLPLVILFYLAAPKKLKNPVLLLSSIVFYAWGEPRYVFLMLGTVLANYILGILIEKHRGRPLAKVYMTVSAVLSLGALGYFKYADFFIENFNRATGLSVGLLNIALPIGISFYTFQILSYTIDVYRGNVKAQKNFITLATYVALFPQLIAGPIVRYIDIERELVCRTHSFEKISVGISRFVTGLSKKVLLANTLGELCAFFQGTTDKSVLFYWLYVVAYMLQVYFDFSGYSDMAIGLGKIFGFEFLENFNYPFISKSITEFWRRWHISLGTWFRDYVYIPMGGNRVNKGRMLFNIFTVWFLTGFWHGAEWNFIVWGLFFGVFLTLEKFFYRSYVEKSRVFGHIYVLFLTAISFAIFGAGSMKEAVTFVGGMFGANALPLVSQTFIYTLKNYWLVLAVGIIASTPLWKRVITPKTEKVWVVVKIPVQVILLLLATAFLADGAFNPFLYFRF